MNRGGEKLKGGIPTHLSPVMLIEKGETEKADAAIAVEVYLPGQTLMRFKG